MMKNKILHLCPRYISLLLLLTIGGLSACSLMSPDESVDVQGKTQTAPEDGVFTLIDSTEAPLVFQPVERESAALLDINPEFDVEIAENSKVTFKLESGASAVVEEKGIMGYSPGDDVVIHIYKVNDGTAYCRKMLDLDHECLGSTSCHAVVRDFESHRATP